MSFRGRVLNSILLLTEVLDELKAEFARLQKEIDQLIKITDYDKQGPILKNRLGTNSNLR
jgi:hypothetical protein